MNDYAVIVKFLKMANYIAIEVDHLVEHYTGYGRVASSEGC